MPLTTASPTIQLQRFDVPSGNAGVGRTLSLMRSLALGGEGAQNPQIRQLASRILVENRVPARDESAEARAFSAWVRDTIRFTGEHNDAVQESIQSPKVTLQMRTGDCDDFSTLLSALLSAVGIQNKFQVVKPQGQENDPSAPYSHVYVIARNKRTGESLILDPTIDSADGSQFSTMQVNSGGAEFGLGLLKHGSTPGTGMVYQGLGCPDCGGTCGGNMNRGGLGDFSSFLSNVLNSPTVATLAQGAATHIAYGGRSSLTTVSSSTASNPFATPAQLNAGMLGTQAGIAPTIPAWMWIAGFGIGGILLFKGFSK